MRKVRRFKRKGADFYHLKPFKLYLSFRSVSESLLDTPKWSFLSTF